MTAEAIAQEREWLRQWASPPDSTAPWYFDPRPACLHLLDALDSLAVEIERLRAVVEAAEYLVRERGLKGRPALAAALAALEETQ